MSVVLIIITLVMFCFAGVLLFGAPYLPTLRPQIIHTFKIAKLKSGSTIIELGCGDGRVLIAAAKHGYCAIGYELNPLLFLVCLLRTFKYRDRVKVIWGDYWRKEWPPADLIFAFILPKYMDKLNKKCIQYNHKPVQLVSFAFKLPGIKPAKTTKGLFLYQFK